MAGLTFLNITQHTELFLAMKQAPIISFQTVNNQPLNGNTLDHSVSWKKCLVTPPAGKVLAAVFSNSSGVLLVDFLECRRTVNANRYRTTLKIFQEAIMRKYLHLRSNGMVLLHYTFHSRTGTCCRNWVWICWTRPVPALFGTQRCATVSRSRSACQDITFPAMKTSNVLPAHGSHSRDTSHRHLGWTQTYHILW